MTSWGYEDCKHYRKQEAHGRHRSSEKQFQSIKTFEHSVTIYHEVE